MGIWYLERLFAVPQKCTFDERLIYKHFASRQLGEMCFIFLIQVGKRFSKGPLESQDPLAFHVFTNALKKRNMK